MAVLDATSLLGIRPFAERAYMLLSFIAHSYIRGRLEDPALEVQS